METFGFLVQTHKEAEDQSARLHSSLSWMLPNEWKSCSVNLQKGEWRMVGKIGVIVRSFSSDNVYVRERVCVDCSLASQKGPWHLLSTSLFSWQKPVSQVLIRGSSPMKRFIFRNSQLDQCNFLIPSHIITTSLMINVIIGQLSKLDPLTL